MAAVVLARPPQTMALTPTLATPAPTSPPISACELLDGMPIAQVMMFQAMAPMSAPNTTRGSTMSAETMPVPTVCATCAPKTRKAMKLKKAAQSTAVCGRSTRVDTMVAIEFAASCSPLRKSNASATTMSAIRSGRASATASISASHVLDHDAVDLVAGVVETVDHLLEMIVDLDADEEGHRVRWLVGAVELLQPGIVQLVGVAFDLGDLLADLVEAAGIGVHGGEQRHRFAHQLGGLHDRVGHLLLLRGERMLVEQGDGLGGLEHLVDGVVHRRDEVLDAAAVERRDEGAADRDQHLAGDVVGVVLTVQHRLVVAEHGIAALEHFAQRGGASRNGVGMAGKQVEKALLARQQGLKPAQHGGPSVRWMARLSTRSSRGWFGWRGAQGGFTQESCLCRRYPGGGMNRRRARLLENLVETPLDAGGFLLDVIVVDRDDLQALEIGRTLWRGDVDAGGIAAVGGKDLLRGVADHEFGEQLGGVRIGRALHHRGGRGNDEHAVRRIERLDRVAFLLEVGGVGIERADCDQRLAALEHVRHMLISLHDHDVVAAQLLVEAPAARLRHGAHHRHLQRREGRIGHHQLALVFGAEQIVPGLRLAR